MLKLTVEHEMSPVPYTVLQVEGELDGSNYLELIARARELAKSGTDRLLVDLSALTYMGSAGLFALHSLALLMKGSEPPNPDDGWGAIHALDTGGGATIDNLKLVNPQPQVDRVLERTGLKRFFEVHADRAAAVASF